MISRSYSCDLCHMSALPEASELIGIKWRTSQDDGKDHLVFCTDVRSVERHLCQRCVRDIKRGEMIRNN